MDTDQTMGEPPMPRETESTMARKSNKREQVKTDSADMGQPEQEAVDQERGQGEKVEQEGASTTPAADAEVVEAPAEEEVEALQGGEPRLVLYIDEDGRRKVLRARCVRICRESDGSVARVQTDDGWITVPTEAIDHVALSD